MLPNAVPPPPQVIARTGQPLPTLGDLLHKPLMEMVRYDTAFVNLLCATSLPDTFDLDIPKCLQTLSEWTSHVKAETDRNMHRFRRAPHQYQNSEAFYRVLIMITVLQQDFGVTYDRESAGKTKFESSSEGFLHGLLTGDHAGTCANMPVLYAAVGRKLGYPIYLVGSKGHLFCRWQDARSGERFNIEASGQGLCVFDDEYYYKWPREITQEEIHHGIFLRNLDPTEEIACFMATRGHCLIDKGHLLDAIIAYSHAHRLAPTCPHILSWLLDALNKDIALRNEGKMPSSYREADQWPGGVPFTFFTLDCRYQDRTHISAAMVLPNGQTSPR